MVDFRHFDGRPCFPIFCLRKLGRLAELGIYCELVGSARHVGACTTYMLGIYSVPIHPPLTRSIKWFVTPTHQQLLGVPRSGGVWSRNRCNNSDSLIPSTLNLMGIQSSAMQDLSCGHKSSTTRFSLLACLKRSSEQ